MILYVLPTAPQTPSFACHEQLLDVNFHMSIQWLFGVGSIIPVSQTGKPRLRKVKLFTCPSSRYQAVSHSKKNPRVILLHSGEHSSIDSIDMEVSTMPGTIHVSLETTLDTSPSQHLSDFTRIPTLSHLYPPLVWSYHGREMLIISLKKKQ